MILACPIVQLLPHFLRPVAQRNVVVLLETCFKLHQFVDATDYPVTQAEKLAAYLALAGAVARRAETDCSYLAHDTGEHRVWPGDGLIVEGPPQKEILAKLDAGDYSLGGIAEPGHV